jgi:transcriptional regulator with XRE-family HTH domain
MGHFDVDEIGVTDRFGEGLELREASGCAMACSQEHLANQQVAHRIRQGRIMLGLSQQQLAPMIGVTYQQIHKYERGLNRISAGRLYDIARVLEMPISWFFEDMGTGLRNQAMTSTQRMCAELARNFFLIENPKHQEAVSVMVRALVKRDLDELPSVGERV